MVKKKKRKSKTGATWLLQHGRRMSQLWYTQEQYDLVKAAADIDRRPMTQFAIMATLEAAKLLLKNAPRLAELGLIGGRRKDGDET